MNLINKLMEKFKNTSPKGGKRGCLCKDGTYDSKCCNGELQEQGVGSTVEQSNVEIIKNNQERTIVSSNG